MNVSMNAKFNHIAPTTSRTGFGFGLNFQAVEGEEEEEDEEDDQDDEEDQDEEIEDEGEEDDGE